MAVNLPTEGDRKSVGGVEYIYYGETGWVRVPKSRSEARSRGYDDGPKAKPKNPMLQGDPEVDPTAKPGGERTIDLSQDPELMGYPGVTPVKVSQKPSVVPSPVENPNDNLADPIAGPGPKGNEVGSDADESTPGLQGPGGGQTTRTSPTGVEQTGRDFSFRLPTREEIEAYAGRTVASPFSSNNLPVSDSDSADNDNTPTFTGPNGEDVEPETEVWSEERGGLVPTIVSDPQREFLNADSAMGGLKAKEAAQGLVYASGKYWVNNPKAGEAGEPQLIEVKGSEAGGENRQAVRDYKAGNIDPQTFFDTYVKGVVDAELKPDNPSDQELDPDTSVSDTDPVEVNADPVDVDEEDEDTQV